MAHEWIADYVDAVFAAYHAIPGAPAYTTSSDLDLACTLWRAWTPLRDVLDQLRTIAEARTNAGTATPLYGLADCIQRKEAA